MYISLFNFSIKAFNITFASMENENHLKLRSFKHTLLNSEYIHEKQHNDNTGYENHVS